MSILNYFLHQIRVIFAPNSLLSPIKVEIKDEELRK